MRLTDPKTASRFHFTGVHYEPSTGEARLSYAFDDGPELTERIQFPYAPWPQEASRQAAFLRALDLLHLVAGVSYYKAGLPRDIDTGDRVLGAELAGFLQDLYEQGLAELAHVNGLDLRGRIRFPAGGDTAAVMDSVELPDRALVAMGGGKDSLVCLEILRTAGIEVQPFTVGDSELIGATVRAAGLPLLQVGRELAPELATMNAAGAWNGHVPVTAINSAIGICAAFLYGYRWVVFANERSADEATLADAHGRTVNHQYSKSLAFEQGLRAVLGSQVSGGVEYFSLLRPLGELAVTERFSRMTQYHAVFSSCNRNFHRDGPRTEGRWCGDCPKCRFTSLALGVFLGPDAVTDIIGVNLLDDDSQVEGYRELCALGVEKPFECVGTVAESRAALAALASRPGWSGCRVVRALAPELPEGGESLDALLKPAGSHSIPPEVQRRVVV